MTFTIKTSAITMMPFIVASLAVYLLGSFGSASWNPVDWTSNARWLCIIWACTWGFVLWARVEYKRGEQA